MLPHRDIDHVLRIQRAASTLKPLLQRALLSLFNQQHQIQPPRVDSNLLSEVRIDPTDYRHWTLSRGIVATRSTPFWGPLDRLSLGLILRETGPIFYRPAMVLASCELILDTLLNMTNPLCSTHDRTNDLIRDLRAEVERQMTQEDTIGERTILAELVSQSKKLMALLEFGIQELGLFPEFERPSPFTGHDVRKVGGNDSNSLSF
jgi:hypothetical protein